MIHRTQQKHMSFSSLCLLVLLLVGCTATPGEMGTDVSSQDAGSSPTAEVQSAEVQGKANEAPAAEAQTTEVQTMEDETLVMTVYKSPTCGCCKKWVEIMEAEGLTVVTEDVADMTVVKAEHGIPSQLQSCHTAVVDGYLIEGHVPADAVQRLLAERPDVTGLAVPGMPVGSPGMEVDGYDVEPFTVMTFDTSGNIEPFANYPE